MKNKLLPIRDFLTYKHSYLFLVLFVFCISCTTSSIEQKSDAQITKSPVVQSDLEKKAAKLAELYDSKKCKEFIDAFPNNFQEFYQFYGYDDKKGANLLYSKPEHITYFFDCSEVSEQDKLQKVISIGIGGKWDADAIGMFQDSAFDLAKNQPEKAKEILDKLPDEKASSFWYFLLDGPHPDKEVKVKRIKLLSGLMGENSKQSKLLMAQYEKVKIDWKDH